MLFRNFMKLQSKGLLFVSPKFCLEKRFRSKLSEERDFDRNFLNIKKIDFQKKSTPHFHTTWRTNPLVFVSKNTLNMYYSWHRVNPPLTHFQRWNQPLTFVENRSFLSLESLGRNLFLQKVSIEISFLDKTWVKRTIRTLKSLKAQSFSLNWKLKDTTFTKEFWRKWI